MGLAQWMAPTKSELNSALPFLLFGGVASPVSLIIVIVNFLNSNFFYFTILTLAVTLALFTGGNSSTIAIYSPSTQHFF